MIYSIVLPGRFPTTFYAYPEFTLLRREIRDEVRFENLNLLFWEYIFSPDFLQFLLRQLGPGSYREIESLATAIDSRIINTLKDPDTFHDPERYLAAVSQLGDYLAKASRLLRQLSSGNLQGLSIYGISYGTQHSLSRVMAYAGSDRSPVGDFYRTRSDLIQGLFMADIVSAVTYSYTDILHLNVLCNLYRRPENTVIIHGHSWENNSVDFLVEHSGQYADILGNIEGIVVADEGLVDTFNRLTESKKAAIPNLHRFHGQFSPAVYTRDWRNDIHDLDFERLRQEADRQRPFIFSPELVTLQRLSHRGCYWSQCSFCRHNSRNSRHSGDAGPGPEELAGWKASLNRLAEVSPVIIFCDQGIDPEAAASLAIIAGDDSIAAKWSFRTRIDPRWDASRLTAMARGGCIEMILGLESINDATLQRMNKTPLAGEAYRALAERIHHDSSSYGIYNHYCAIYGYPGETYAECRKTLGFLAGLIQEEPRTTFSLNRFQLLFKSEVYNRPDIYGISSVTKAGPLSNMFLHDEPNSRRSIGRVEKGLLDLYKEIGYREDIVANQIVLGTLTAFLNDSGHTPLFKMGISGNPFIAGKRNSGQ